MKEVSSTHQFRWQEQAVYKNQKWVWTSLYQSWPMTIGLSILLSFTSSMGFLSFINLPTLENPPSVAPGSGDATLLAPPEFQGPLKLQELQGLHLQLRNSKIIRSLSSCRSKAVKNPGVVVKAIKKSRMYHEWLCNLILLDRGKLIVTNPGEKRCLPCWEN